MDSVRGALFGAFESIRACTFMLACVVPLGFVAKLSGWACLAVVSRGRRGEFAGSRCVLRRLWTCVSRGERVGAMRFLLSAPNV